MKRAIAALLIIMLFPNIFSACAPLHVKQPRPTTAEEGNPDAQSDSQADSTVPAPYNLTHHDIINWLNAYADENNLDHVSNVEEFQNEDPSVMAYSFTFMDEEIVITVHETNGVVTSILSAVFPFSMPDVSTREEGIQLGIELATLPVLSCDPNFDAQSGLTWHMEQITQETDSSLGSCKYTRDNWEYSLTVDDISVMIHATKQDNITPTTPTQGSDLAQMLDLSKGWKVDFVCEETEGTFHYAFLKDGSCYLLMSDGFSPWGGGKGTYRINGNSLELSISMDGCRFDYSYDFDPQTGTLTHTSGTPVFAGLAATGDKYKLEEDDANTASKIKEMAQGFIDSYADDGDI